MDEQSYSVPTALRSVLSHGQFTRYMAGEAVSMTGTWMQVMAQNWVMTTLTASAAMLGLVNFAAGLPMIALSMVGGSLADRYDRRNILLTTQVVQIALALVTLRPRDQGSAEEEARRRGGIKEGLAYVRADKPTLGLIALMAATTVFVFPAMVVMLPLYAKNLLQLGPDRMGLLMGISSIGSFTGSVSLLAVPRRRRCGLMLAAVIAAAAALTSLSQAQRFPVAAVSLVVLSLGVSTLIGLANTIVQERAPSPLRGRVSAIAGLSFFGLMPFASLGITSVADWLGMRTALLAAAVLYLGTALPVLIGSRRRIYEVPPMMAKTGPLSVTSLPSR